MRIDNPDQYRGKVIRVYFLDGHASVDGEYDGFTTEYDDPDGRANISVDLIEESGWGYDLYEDEIERIEVIGDAKNG